MRGSLWDVGIFQEGKLCVWSQGMEPSRYQLFWSIIAGAQGTRVEAVGDEAEDMAWVDHGTPWTMFELLTIDVKEPWLQGFKKGILFYQTFVLGRWHGGSVKDGLRGCYFTPKFYPASQMQNLRVHFFLPISFLITVELPLKFSQKILICYCISGKDLYASSVLDPAFCLNFGNYLNAINSPCTVC